MGRFCDERHRFRHIIFTQMFIYGNIKSTSSHVHTIYNNILLSWNFCSHDNQIKTFLTML